MKKNSKAQIYGESSFDVCYLVIVNVLGVLYLLQGIQIGSKVLILYGTMALILGIGDSFHLIPRILSHLSNHDSKWNPYLGIGKMITSITMTIMYVVLFYLWKAMYPSLQGDTTLEVVILLLAILRIGLCLFPQNHWISNHDFGKWPIYRNLPFIILGCIIVVIYSYSAILYQDAFCWMPVAIILSFTFYIPVILFADRYPKVGMLMILKTLMYLWMIFMGISLL